MGFPIINLNMKSKRCDHKLLEKKTLQVHKYTIVKKLLCIYESIKKIFDNGLCSILYSSLLKNNR